MPGADHGWTRDGGRAGSRDAGLTAHVPKRRLEANLMGDLRAAPTPLSAARCFERPPADGRCRVRRAGQRLSRTNRGPVVPPDCHGGLAMFSAKTHKECDRVLISMQ